MYTGPRKRMEGVIGLNGPRWMMRGRIFIPCGIKRGMRKMRRRREKHHNSADRKRTLRLISRYLAMHTILNIHIPIMFNPNQPGSCLLVTSLMPFPIPQTFRHSLAQSPTKTRPSHPTLPTHPSPNKLQSTPYANSVCPSQIATALPKSKSHIRTLISYDALANRFPVWGHVAIFRTANP